MGVSHDIFSNCFQSDLRPFTERDKTGILDYARHIEAFLNAQQLYWYLQEEKENVEREINFYQSLSEGISKSDTLSDLYNEIQNQIISSNLFEDFCFYRSDVVTNYPFGEFQASWTKKNY